MPLTKFKRGATWYIRGTVRGQSVYESAGTGDEAAAEAIRIQKEARLLEESVYGKKATVLFHEAAESFIASGGSPRFIIEYSKTAKKANGLAVYFRGRQLHSITQQDLDSAALKLYPNCLPETRIRQCYAPFIAVWNHAVRNQWAEPRQWARPKRHKGTAPAQLKKYRSGSRPVTYDLASRFIGAMSPAPAMLMTALFYTGMRPIELFHLTTENINIAQRWLIIPSSKTGEPRGVPIHEFLVPVFQSLSIRDGPIFRTHKGEPYTIVHAAGGQLKTAIAGARKRTNITDISPYTARHTVSTQLVVNGIHPHVKDQILGHAVDDMSRRYTNVPQMPLIEAINTLPVPDLWMEMEWLRDPIEYSGKLINPNKISKNSDPCKMRAS